MADQTPFDGDIDTWPDIWDSDREDPRWIPPGAAPPKFLIAQTHTMAVEEANHLLVNSGFAMTIDKPLITRPSKARPYKLTRGAVLRCASGRQYTSTGSESRKQSSRMTGCTWSARMKRVEQDIGDAPGWSFEVQDPRHNHPLVGKFALPQFRKRDEQSLRRIETHLNNRDSAMKTLRNLRGTGENLRRYDVSNEMAKLRRAELGGRTRIEALAKFLQTYSTDDSGSDESKFYQHMTQDEHGRARIVFFSHPLAFSLIKSNPDVVQIDATYKTNLFHMPLVHITGVTSRDTTYDIGYAFVPNEEVQTYNEVIRMLAELFDWLQVVPKCFITDHDKPLKAALTSIFPDTPQRRCIWHINQNVQAKSVKVWDLNKARTVPEKESMNTARLDFIQHWQQLVNCKTADSFWV
ncbi:hypothetical protein PTMSG1_02984 [Pyrenophora teres f. maculata]|nr:hypothetical protein PTMSG1_02984 [Pyrenophora teres f. maculata]